MKKFPLIISLFFLLLSLGCKKPIPVATTDNTGGSSSSGGSSNIAFTQASVEINATWASPYPQNNACLQAFTVTIGLGYNSTDLTNGSFFYSVTNTQGISLKKGGLKGGTYYYKVIKRWNGTCGAFTPTVEKVGSFTIIPPYGILISLFL